MQDFTRPHSRVISPVRQRDIPLITCDGCGRPIGKGQRIIVTFGKIGIQHTHEGDCEPDE